MTTNADPNAVLTVDQAREYMHVSRDKLVQLINDEGLPAVRLGRRWFIPKKSLDDWLTERATSASAARTKANRVRKASR